MEVAESSKSFRLTRGLSVKDVVDHYAVLGLPITCEVEEIRSRFKSLSKSLHPDVYSLSTVQRGWATQYYAKLVTPAYKVLDNDSARNEYFATLRYLATDLKKAEQPPEVQSELAQKLLRFPHEVNYKQYVAEVAAKQYASLSKVLEYTNELSEINLIFLYTQAEISQPIRLKVVAAPVTLPPLPQVSSQSSSKAQPKIKQAEALMAKKKWQEALAELKAAEKLDPNVAQIYALLGLVYVAQKSNKVAKSYFQKALKLDPKNAIALEQTGAKPKSAGQKPEPKVDPKSKSASQKPQQGGGLFGLFKRKN